MALHVPRKNIKFESIAMSMADAQRIFERLQIQIADQANVELNALVKPLEETDANFAARKEDLRARVFRITVTLNGTDGSQLYGDEASLFTSPNRPNHIQSIYMTNVTAYQAVTGQRPVNFFEFFLDFSKPMLLDPNRLVSSPTPNESNLSVGGVRDGWVAAVADAVTGVLVDRKTKRGWVHRAFVYDAGLLLVGIPIALYACLRASGLINLLFGTLHPFVVAAAYVYTFFIAIWAYRVLFGYTKWAFPTVELVDNRDAAKVHRGVWLLIILGLVVDVAWEIGRALF